MYKLQSVSPGKAPIQPKLGLELTGGDENRQFGLSTFVCRCHPGYQDLNYAKKLIRNFQPNSVL